MMERGGAAALHSNLRLHSWPLLSCSRVLLRPAPKPLLDTRFRHYTCSKGKGYLLMKKALVLNDSRMSPRVLKSCGQGANVNNEEMKKHKFLIDCGSDQECVLGGIVALGKFDALHIGHRELVIQASKVGIPFLLSFVGMAEVLGWEYRAPIVAKSDRKRVLSSWAPFCGNVVPLEFQVQFSNVRHLTPRQFVERLSEDLRVSGVVAGKNYRFGYKASGDATELVRLCDEYGLSSCIVDPVMDKTRRYNGILQKSISSSDRGQVSSSRVRNALAMGDMDYVAELLGRKHRLVLELNELCRCTDGRISAPRSCMLNQPPKDGEFDRCNLVVNDEVVGQYRVVLNSETVDLELDVGGFLAEDLVCRNRLIGLEFG